MRRRTTGNDVCGHVEIEHYAKGMCKVCYSAQPEMKVKRKIYDKTTEGIASIAKYRQSEKGRTTHALALSRPHIRASKLVSSSRQSTVERQARGRNMCDSELTTEWVIKQYERQQGNCYWTGAPISWSEHGKLKLHDRTPWSVSLDRKDPTIGYTQDNTVLAAWCTMPFEGR